MQRPKYELYKEDILKRVFVDFDGVILNSNKIVGKLIKDNVNDLNNEESIHSFMETVDWDFVMKQASEIEDSVMWLNNLAESNEVTVLSHISSVQEMMHKIAFVRNKLPKLNIICVPKKVRKVHMFSEVKDTILIDDYIKNTNEWNEGGGIGILFSTKKEKQDRENNIIGNIKEVISIIEEMEI